MDLNRFTHKSQEALQAAQGVAARHSHQEVDVEHLLVALLEQKDGLVPRILARDGTDPAEVSRWLSSELAKRPRVSGPGAEQGRIYVTQALQKVLDEADAEAKGMKDGYVSVEHLVLAALGKSGKRSVSEGLSKLGFDREGALQAVRDVRGQ